MSTHYFVEILNHHGDVKRREKFSTLPLNIGRHYSNDIIVDDPHCAAEHAVLEINEAGEFIIRDLASRNGLYLAKKSAPMFLINGDDIFRLGQTLVRIRTEEYAVADEIPYQINHRWGNWSQAIIGLATIILLTLLSTWLSDFEEDNFKAYVTATFTLLGLVAAWAGLFALANRIFVGLAYFSLHLLIVCLAIIAFELVDYGKVFLAYSFSWELLSRYSSHVEIAIMAVALYYHLLQISPPQKSRLLQLLCAGIALISSGLVLMNNHHATRQLADELYSPYLLPPSTRISRDYSLTEFGSDISQLKTAVDAEQTDAAVDE